MTLGKAPGSTPTVSVIGTLAPLANPDGHGDVYKYTYLDADKYPY